MSLHTVTLLPSGARQMFPWGTLLSDALIDMGVPLETSCGGKGICGRCTVAVGQIPEEVIACRTPLTRDITVRAGQAAREGPVALPAVPVSSALSLAVDIGTTTVRISLADITRGSTFEIASFLNPQRRHGHDVISRIAAARDRSKLRSLKKLLREALSVRIENALRAMSIEGGRIERVVFSGNTTMLFLLYGIDVIPLGAAPYPLRIRDFPALSARDLGLACIGQAAAEALPVLGAFTGADLVGALALCAEQGIGKNAFFIDLGTNGELFVLDGRGRAFATSCAMGPALEGMSVSWGMTADHGAITRVMEGPSGLEFRMIGQGVPRGIAGTALVDLSAILLQKGVIQPCGAFSSGPGGPPLPAPLALEQDKGGRHIGLWGKIRLTQKDVRSLQLAKGASLAASLILLEEAGREPGDIERVLVAGTFGEHLDLENFRRLGFIPDFPGARMEFLGNTSLMAAERACIDPGFIARAASHRDKARDIALSARPGFQDLFLRSLEFPV